ncbi:MAG: 6-phosphogluconolactonase, partial [Verrucomicrobia bacterium]|nr:6-phosphogluconolactonase [Verrucomicrobiota bacterium]
ALPGGRIANKFYRSIVQQAPHDPALLGAIHLFWADERCVAPDDGDSNFRTASELLIEPLKLQPAQVHRIQGELPPPAGAAAAEASLNSVLGRSGSRALDLVILGMGEDGHVASLFPGDNWEDQNHPPLYRSVVAVKPPPNRVTLTYRALKEAAQVWVLASGAGKRDALRQSLSTDSTPLGRVRSQRSQVRVFSDIQ